jgi:aminoglycoside 3-N-acetyltransferase
MRLSYNDLEAGIRALQISSRTPVVVHASLSALGWVRGGAGALVDVLHSNFECLLMPAFTYKTMLIPEAGPAHNGMVYGTGRDRNRMAVFYYPGMPVDRLIGAIPEALRTHPGSTRSRHPILSFTGLGAGPFLERQTLQDPFGPLAALAESGGWVLLWGVDHTANTSLHIAEQQAGRPAFVRWALTPSGVRRCESFPGCSLGFGPLAAELAAMTRRTRIGNGWVLALPLRAMIEKAADMIRQRPAGYLCGGLACSRCREVRRWALGVSLPQPAAA